jgi:hypothetical protein
VLYFCIIAAFRAYSSSVSDGSSSIISVRRFLYPPVRMGCFVGAGLFVFIPLDAGWDLGRL